jgi:hypothetical protein
MVYNRFNHLYLSRSSGDVIKLHVESSCASRCAAAEVA